MKAKVDKILLHNANVFINRQFIYNYPESIFAEKRSMAIEHAHFEGIERLAAVTGGEVVSTFDHPELVTLGECDVIEEVSVFANEYCLHYEFWSSPFVTHHWLLCFVSNKQTNKQTTIVRRFSWAKTRFCVLVGARLATHVPLYCEEPVLMRSGMPLSS
jgi:TCP-1/cpn60 chaperonin family